MNNINRKIIEGGSVLTATLNGKHLRRVTLSNNGGIPLVVEESCLDLALLQINGGNKKQAPDEGLMIPTSWTDHLLLLGYSLEVRRPNRVRATVQAKLIRESAYKENGGPMRNFPQTVRGVGSSLDEALADAFASIEELYLDVAVVTMRHIGED